MSLQALYIPLLLLALNVAATPVTSEEQPRTEFTQIDPQQEAHKALRRNDTRFLAVQGDTRLYPGLPKFLGFLTDEAGTFVLPETPALYEDDAHAEYSRNATGFAAAYNDVIADHLFGELLRQTPKRFWKLYHQAAVDFLRCKNVSDFLRSSRWLHGSAELHEAYAKTIESLVLEEPKCFLKGASQLDDDSLKAFSRLYVDQPLFHSAQEIEAALAPFSHEYPAVKILLGVR